MQLPSDMGPLVTSIIAVLAVLGVGLIGRSVSNKIVARESGDGYVTMYRRAAPEHRIEAQLEERARSFTMARNARRLYVWCVVGSVFALSSYVTMLMLSSVRNFSMIVILALLATLPAVLVWLLLARNPVVFPDLPEREEWVDPEPLDAFANQPVVAGLTERKRFPLTSAGKPSFPMGATVVTATDMAGLSRPGRGVKQASRRRKKGRKKTQESRRKNRRG